MGGILTEDEVQPNVIYVNYNQKSGQFATRDGDIPGIEGTLRGFKEHIFTYEGEDLQKFDIFLEDDGKIYNVQVGKHTWVALHIMNSLHSLPLEPRPVGVLRIVGYQKDGMNKLFMTFNGEKLSWKYDSDALKLPEDKEKRAAKKDKLCDKMFDVLYEKMPYVELATNGNAEEQPAEMAAVDDDDIPF